MSHEIDHDRRRFFSAAMMSLGAAEMMISSSAASKPAKAAPPVSQLTFGPLHQMEAGVLSIGYAAAGPADGTAVVLLRGWPYDIHSFTEVASLSARRGYRVIIPYLRGFGTTRFLAANTMRNGASCRRSRHYRFDGRSQDQTRRYLGVGDTIVR